MAIDELLAAFCRNRQPQKKRVFMIKKTFRTRDERNPFVSAIVQSRRSKRNSKMWARPRCESLARILSFLTQSNTSPTTILLLGHIRRETPRLCTGI